MSSVLHVAFLQGSEAGHFAADSEGRLLTVETDAAQTSPLRNVGQAARLFAERFGGRVWVRRAEQASIQDRAVRSYLLVTREQIEADWRTLADLRVPGSDLPAEPLLPDDGAGVPWFSADFPDEAEDWVARTLRSHDRALVGPLTQVRHWVGSTVSRADTDQGVVFFKATPVGEAEGPKTAAIAELAPDLVIPPLEIDSARGWMLVPAAPGEPMSRSGGPGSWSELIRRYARLQIASLEARDELTAAGVAPLELDRLAQDADDLLSERRLLTGPGMLGDGDHDRLMAVGQDWLGALRSLAGSDLPFVLEHGDLDSHQVMIEGGATWVLDWADSMLAPPFIGLETFLRTLHEGAGSVSGKGTLARAWSRFTASTDKAVTEARAGLTDEYLAVWRTAFPDADLRRWHRMTVDAFPLIRATLYWRWLRGLEDTTEAAPTLGEYLRHDLALGSAAR